MSDVLYPLGAISAMEVKPFTRVVLDEFEDGTTSARRQWSDKYFKRRFELTHAALSLSEFRWLKGFHTQRNGQYDSFWFRDNVNRGGNGKVRFASNFPQPKSRTVYENVRVTLEEVAPIRMLPEIDEVVGGAGSSPFVWYDANREIYLTHAGAAAVVESSVHDAVSGLYPAAWYAGALNLGNVLGQWQHFAFTGTQKAKSASNVTLAGTKPACTVFAIVKHSATATFQVLLSVGASGGSGGAGTALGIALAEDNRYEPWLGNDDTTFTNARFNNSAADTWRSVAVVFAAGSDNATLYVNAVSIGTDALSRSYTAGPVALGAEPAGDSVANPGGAMANCSLAHGMMFNGALTLAQVKALHNLLGYQYGLATVA